MKPISITSHNYHYEHGDYIVTIELNRDTWECWLRHKDYGIRSLMFGLMVADCPALSCVKPIVKANLDEYIELYREKYEEE